MGRAIDLTGQRFGKLTVIEKSEKDKWNRWQWLCRCDCGNEVVIRSNNLRTGNSESCGCQHNVLGRGLRDLSGETFGRLSVIERDTSKLEYGRTYWRCICECGEEVSVWMAKLVRGEAVSCKRRGAHASSKSWSLRLWSDKVKERDKHTCQKCGLSEKGGKMHAHHILSSTAYEDKRLDVGNGACLCVECHKDFHNKYGVMKHTESDFYSWLADEHLAKKAKD